VAYALRPKKTMFFDINWANARTLKFSESFLRALELLLIRNVPGAKGKHVSVSFVSAQKIKNLNRIYRKKNRPTDVLSFAALEGERFPGDANFAGDVVICLAYVRASAKKQKVDFSEEVVRMFVHGAMHCLGYDHMKPEDEKRMFPLQEKIITEAMKKYAP